MLPSSHIEKLLNKISSLNFANSFKINFIKQQYSVATWQKHRDNIGIKMRNGNKSLGINPEKIPSRNSKQQYKDVT